MGDGQDYQTKSEVMVLITEGLKDYEQRYIVPRHKETQGSIADLKKMAWAVILLLIAAIVTATTDLVKDHQQPHYQPPVQHSDLY